MGALRPLPFFGAIKGSVRLVFVWLESLPANASDEDKFRQKFRRAYLLNVLYLDIMIF
jgi:hypothetical protein